MLSLLRERPQAGSEADPGAGVVGCKAPQLRREERNGSGAGVPVSTDATTEGRGPRRRGCHQFPMIRKPPLWCFKRHAKTRSQGPSRHLAAHHARTEERKGARRRADQGCRWGGGNAGGGGHVRGSRSAVVGGEVHPIPSRERARVAGMTRKTCALHKRTTVHACIVLSFMGQTESALQQPTGREPWRKCYLGLAVLLQSVSEVPATRKAATQIGVTFTREDLDVLDALHQVNQKTGIPVSALIRQSVRAALMQDADALQTLTVYHSFSSVTAPVTFRAPITG